MTVLQEMTRFSDCFGKIIPVNQTPWRYYSLGTGSPILWLTGGMRRAALGFAFMERLAANHRVIAPDYPPVKTIDEYLEAFDAILKAESIDQFILVGQSYGGMLAQAYLAHRPQAVERLILSSSGPADYQQAWLPVEYAFIALARLLPEKTVKNLLAGGLLKVFSFPEAQREEWTAAIHAIMQNELTRADVISHFAVAADLIHKRRVAPPAYRGWPGKVMVLSASNDPTQSEKDLPRYEKLFGRPVRVIDMASMGHTAAIFNPDRYVELIEQALAE